MSSDKIDFDFHSWAIQHYQTCQGQRGCTDTVCGTVNGQVWMGLFNHLASQGQMVRPSG